MNLQNKKILFISHPLMGYHCLIGNELRRRGAKVKWVSQTNPSILEKIYLELYPQKGWNRLQSYWYSVVSKISNVYDIVLIVNAGSMPYAVIQQLRQSMPSVAFISYNWDDFECIGSNMAASLKFFDRALTYNIIEAEEHNIVPRPFFYDDKILTKPNWKGKIKDIDLFFVGTCNAQRLDFMKTLRDKNDTSDLKILSWLYLNPVRLFNGKLTHQDFKDIRLRKLPYSKMMQYVARSRCSLDIQFKQQSGITTRAIESLPLRTKIITNNRNMLRYDFYRLENVMLIDPDHPVIDKEWLREPFADVDKDIVERYSIRSWVDDVFDV